MRPGNRAGEAVRENRSQHLRLLQFQPGRRLDCTTLLTGEGKSLQNNSTVSCSCAQNRKSQVCSQAISKEMRKAGRSKGTHALRRYSSWLKGSINDEFPMTKQSFYESWCLSLKRPRFAADKSNDLA